MNVRMKVMRAVALGLFVLGASLVLFGTYVVFNLIVNSTLGPTGIGGGIAASALFYGLVILVISYVMRKRVGENESGS